MQQCPHCHSEHVQLLKQTEQRQHSPLSRLSTFSPMTLATVAMQMSKRMGVLVSKLSVRLLLPKLAMQSLVQSWEQLRLATLSLSKSTWCFVRLLQPVVLKPRQTQLIVSLRVIARIPHQQAGMVRHLHKNRAMTKQQLGKKIFKELINAA